MNASVDAKDALIVGASAVNPRRTAKKTLERWKTEGFTPPGRSGTTTPVPFVLPMDWSEGEKRDANFRMHLHGWRNADPYFVLHSETGRSKHLKAACEIACDWLRFMLASDEPVNRSWYDQSTGLRALKIAYCIHYGLGKHGVRIDNALMVLWNLHMTYLLCTKNISHSNHGLFQLHGLKALSWVLSEAPISQQGSDAAYEGMVNLLHYQFDENGVHREGAPEYHFYTLETIECILDAPWWRDVQFSDLGPCALEDIRQVGLKFIMPNGRCVPVGDSAGKEVEIPGQSEAFCRDHAGDLGNGYVVINGSAIPSECGSYLFVNGSYDTDIHKHDDCLSIVWWENGRAILVDAGKYRTKDEHRGEVQGARGHNTLCIDGYGYIECGGVPFGNAVREVERQSSNVWLVSCAVTWGRKNCLHERWTVVEQGVRLIVVDRVLCDSERHLEFNWHFSEQYCFGHGSEEVTVLTDSATTDSVVFRQRMYDSFRNAELEKGISADFHCSMRPKGVMGKSRALENHPVCSLGITGYELVSIAEIGACRGALQSEAVVRRGDDGQYTLKCSNLYVPLDAVDRGAR